MERKQQVSVDPYGRDLPSPIPHPTSTGANTPRARIFRPATANPIPINTRDIESIIREHLAANEPEAMRHLFATWNAQARSIKDQEIRNALRDGDISPRVWAELTQQYADFVNGRLVPRWMTSLEAGHTAYGAGLDRPLPFAAARAHTRDWIAARGAELVSDLTSSQRQAVRNLVSHYTTQEQVSARELGRLLRPAIGLTPRLQRAANVLRDRLLESGFTRTQATGRAIEYGLWHRRMRAERIARTEMAFAFNFGGFHHMRQQVAEENIQGEITKTWLTAQDERVCPHCGPLHEAIIDLEETYPAATRRIQTTFVPPAHPSCRCTVVYSVVGGLADTVAAR